MTSVANPRAEPQRRSKGRRDTGTRERLVAAARECLRTSGHDGASSRAIAARAEANLAAITYHFGSKEALVDEALASELRTWTNPALDALDGDGDPARRLLDAVAALNAAFDVARTDSPALLEVFVHSTRDASDAPVTAVWHELRTRLAAVVIQLLDARAIPAWVDPDTMATLVLTIGAGTVVASAVDPEGTDHRAIGALVTALLLSARPAP